MHPLPSKLVFSTGQNHPEGVQNRKISPDGDHASALIFGGPTQASYSTVPQGKGIDSLRAINRPFPTKCIPREREPPTDEQNHEKGGAFR